MSLGTIAASKGILYGAATIADYVSTSAFMANIANDCSMVSFANDLKFGACSPSQGNFNFSNAQILKNWGDAHAMKYRGNTLLWERNDSLPGWFRSGSFTQTQTFDIMQAYITHAMQFVKAHSWDVCNELFANDPTQAQNGYGMLTSIYGGPCYWLPRCGQDYPEKAYRFASQADPQAKLCLNDYGVELGGSYNQKFANMLALVDRLQTKNIPIHAIGFQLHLGPGATIIGSGDNWNIFDAARLKTKLDQIKARGLEVHITENDWTLGSTPTSQGAILQKAVMDAFLSHPSVTVWQMWDYRSYRTGASGDTTSLYDQNFNVIPDYFNAVQASLNATPVRGTPAPVSTPTPTPGPTPMPTQSPDGTQMLAIPTTDHLAVSLVTSDGATWQYGAATTGGNKQLLRNGVFQTYTSATVSVMQGGQVIQTNAAEVAKGASGVWYKSGAATNGQVAWTIVGSPLPAPAPTPTPTPAPTPVIDQAAARAALTSLQTDLDKLKAIIG